MLYLNGDNDLTHEVLYAVDMLETVGSSDYINILALVDGRPGSGHPYGDSWDASRLLYITRDARIGEINSAILQDMGEQNLGQPETLEYFIRKGLRYPAEHYIFCTFTHGRGIIDTKTLKLPRPHKSLAISIDDTDASQMTLSEFQHAVQRGLNGKKFDAMVFFSCLTGMVEVGYAFKDLTDYLIGSEDEIRIVNNPPGSFQIRGIKFEEPLKAIQFNPDLTPYDFAKYVLERLHNSSNVTLLMELRATLTETQRYASFMNLEYYDLQDFFNKLAEKTGNMHLKKHVPISLTS